MSTTVFLVFCQFEIIASKLPLCSVSSLISLSSSCRKGLTPFSSKVFAKPLSCLHFGHVFVNAAWPLPYQRLTHDSQPTTEEQERQQINGGFGGQTLQMVQEKLSSAAFNSPIGICRLDEILKIFATAPLRFLFLKVFPMTQDMVTPIFFFSELLCPRCLLLPFQNFAGNSQDLQHLLRILSTMLLSNTMIL